jgi:hypothetical protein
MSKTKYRIKYQFSKIDELVISARDSEEAVNLFRGAQERTLTDKSVSVKIVSVEQVW